MRILIIWLELEVNVNLFIYTLLSPNSRAASPWANERIMLDPENQNEETTSGLHLLKGQDILVNRKWVD